MMLPYMKIVIKSILVRFGWLLEKIYKKNPVAKVTKFTQLEPKPHYA